MSTLQALLDSIGPTVESAVAEETDGLPEMVDDFENVFYDDPILRFVQANTVMFEIRSLKSNVYHFTRTVYRDQLVAFVETGLKRNLVAKLSPPICGRVETMQLDIISRLIMNIVQYTQFFIRDTLKF